MTKRKKNLDKGHWCWKRILQVGWSRKASRKWGHRSKDERREGASQKGVWVQSLIHWGEQPVQRPWDERVLRVFQELQGREDDRWRGRVKSALWALRTHAVLWKGWEALGEILSRGMKWPDFVLKRWLWLLWAGCRGYRHGWEQGSRMGRR